MANFTAVGVQAQVQGFNKFVSQLGQMNKAISTVGSPIGSVTNQFVGFGNSILKVGAIAGGVALAGVTALGVAIGKMTTDGIRGAIDLDAQMATIAATMNITKDAATPLKDLILDLALDPNLTVNTQQAADAIQLLAQNGATANEIIGGLAKSTVALANATGANFGTAADIASGVLRIFNIDAKNMGTAIDGITGVVNQSKFTIEDYGLAFAQAGGIAAGMGVKLQDLNAVIAGTSTSFASGSDAGTSFKTFLQRLADPTDEVLSLMQKYNISLFDAAGKMRPMREVVGQLHTAFSGLTEAQKAQVAAQLGGADAARTVLALSKMSVDEFDKLSGSVNESGQAFRSAATRVDSVRGALDILGGIIEAIQLQIGDKFLVMIRGFTVEFSDLASKYGPQVVSFFGELANSIGVLIVKSAKLFAAFQSGGVGGLFSALGITPQAAELFNKITLLLSQLGGTILGIFAPAIDSLTSGGALDMLNQAIIFVNQNFEAFKGAIIGIGAVLAGSAIAALIAGIVAAISSIGPAVLLTIGAAAALGAAWATNWNNIQAYALTAWAVLQSVFAGIMAGLQPLQVAFNQLTAELAKMGISWTDIGNALLTSIGLVAAGIGVLIVGLISIVTGFASAWVAATSQVVAVFNQFMAAVQQIGLGVVQILSGDILGGFNTLIMGIGEAINALITGPFQIMTASMQALVQSIIGFWQNLYMSLVGGSIIPDLVNSIIDWFGRLAQPVLDILTNLTTQISTIFGSLFGNFGGEGGGLNLSSLTQLPTAIATAAASMTTLQDAIQATGMIMESVLGGAAKKFMDSMRSGMDYLLTSANSFNDALNQAIRLILPTFAETVAELGISSGKAFKDIAAAVSSITTALQNLKRVNIGGDIANDINKAITAMKNLKSSINSVIEALEDIVKAANEAAAAMAQVGISNNSLRGAGFQSGTGARGFTVPPGYPDDSYPVGLSSGEKMIVARRGQTIEQIVAPRILQQYALATPAGVQLQFGPNYIQQPLDIEMIAEAVKRKLVGAM